MAIITGKSNVQRVYDEAIERGWVLPCFNSENLTTTEAILEASKSYGEIIGIPNLPIIIGITAQYGDRPQSVLYSHTRKWDVGLRIFLEELKVLAGEGGPYEDLKVLIHLDHILHEVDKELLKWDLSQFSSIMYDASHLPFEENIAATTKFVQEYAHLLLVEGACDEIRESGEEESSEITSAEKAEYYYRSTGVDTIVANLGTEHRASSSELQYRGDSARNIKERLGSKLVLHGGSSVDASSISKLAEDGIVKVNVWTLLERESAPVLFEHMVRNAGRVAGESTVERLQSEGILGTTGGVVEKANLDYFSTTARQEIIYNCMKEIIKDYLTIWYK
ncbi:class II fructose-bisphosphate aldolase [Neobacillus sp. 179-J 1A1 HS]|uniref:class II fructose-bisphosphate aldolase n=1 Tax=Neobacillus driksii TaxID=3035913 RepID=UPI0035BBF6F1